MSCSRRMHFIVRFYFGKKTPGRRFEPGASEVRSRSINHLAAKYDRWYATKVENIRQSQKTDVKFQEKEYIWGLCLLDTLRVFNWSFMFPFLDRRGVGLLEYSSDKDRGTHCWTQHLILEPSTLGWFANWHVRETSFKLLSLFGHLPSN
jgi:hypothetical protein